MLTFTIMKWNTISYMNFKDFLIKWVDLFRSRRFQKTKLCYFLMGSDVTHNISNQIDFPFSTNTYVLCTTYEHSTKLDGMI